MASLLSWLGNEAKKVKRNVQNDIVAPIQRDVIRPVQGAVAQVNPADGGRTYQTVTQRGPSYAPRPTMSAVGQLTHNGATNFAGGVVKPLVQFPLDAGDLAYNKVVAPTFKLPQQHLQDNPVLGGVSRYSGANGSVRQTIGSGIQTGLAIGTGGVGRGISKSFEAVAPKAIPKIVPRVLTGAGTGAVVGGPYNAAAVVSSGEPLTLKKLKDSTVQGAQLGAALGAGGELAAAAAPVAFRGTVSGAKGVNKEIKAANLRAKQDATANAQQAKIDTAVKSYTKQYKQNQARGLKDSHPAQVNLRKALKELDQQQLNVQPRAVRTARQKVTDKILTTRPGGSIQRVNDEIPEPLKASTKTGKLPEVPTQSSGSRVSSSGAVSSPSRMSRSSGRYPSPAQPVDQVKAGEMPSSEAVGLRPNGLDSAERNPAELQSADSQALLRRQTQRDLLQNSYRQSTPKRGFIQSVNSSQEVSPTVRGRASGTYQVRSTKALEQKAMEFAGKNPNKAAETVSSSLRKKTGTVSDQEIANAIAVAKRLDANKNHAQATDIYENLSKHLTKQGQAIQAASLLDHRTPEGIRYHITKAFTKAGVKPSDELNAKIDDHIKTIRGTKSGTPERIKAVKELQKLVADNLPSSASDKAIAFWKAGLITGVRPQTGNILSNETFSVLHNASNPLAAALDKAISLKTGVRTKTLTGRGLVSGTGQGIERAGSYLKTGIDERSPLTNKFEGHQVNFKNKAVNTYVNGVFRLMGAADRPHYYRQLQNSLYDLGTADAKNRGLSGAQAQAHIKNFVENPPDSAFQLATNEAEKAVLGNDTILSRAVAKLRQTAEDAESPLGKAVTEATINVLMPFTKVPSAFVSRVVDYTPVGAIKEAVTQISRKQFDQRALVTAISEGATGTGLIYLGTKLSQAGLLSGNYPTDPHEQQRWKAQGIQPNSLHLGNAWLSLNYLGPVGLLFAAGSRVNDSLKQGQGALNAATSAVAGIPKDLTEQSFLQGLNNGLQAINEPGRYASNFVKSQVSSAIPTLSNDIATATDNFQRQSNNVAQGVESRIPGLRETLNRAQDVYGNDLKRKTSAAGTIANPFRPSTALTNSVKAEVERLHNADPNNSDLQVTPTALKQTLSIEGKQVKLSDQQRYDLQKQIGQSTQKLWGQLIQTPAYKQLDDVDKANALNKLRTDATTLAEREFVTKNDLGTYSKQASAAVARLGMGQTDLAAYAKPIGSGGSGSSSSNPANYTTPDAEYKAFQATYNQKLKDGSYSDAQKITANQKLAKLKVGAVYPKDVRDLYGLSKANAYQYLTTAEKGKDKAKMAKQLEAYDKALYDAGLTSYLKYKNGIAPAARKAKVGKKAGSRATGKASLNTILSTLKTTDAAAKPSAAPKSPHIAVKTTKLPSGYKQVALKKYAVKRVTAQKTKNA